MKKMMTGTGRPNTGIEPLLCACTVPNQLSYPAHTSVYDIYLFFDQFEINK